MPRKPCVMLVGPWPPTRGGVTTFMLNVVNSSLANEYAFVRFTTSRPLKRIVSRAYGYRAMFRAGLPAFCVSALTTLWHVAKFPFVVLIERPDIVQVQASDFQAFWEAAIYVGMCRLVGKPVLMRIGGSFDHFYRSSSARFQGAIRRVLSWPDRLIVQAECWAEFVRGCGRRGGVVVLPNMVSEEFAAADVRRSHDAIVCLFIAGTEAAWKGMEEVIAAIRILRAEGDSIRFRILAAPDGLKKRLEDAHISDIVSLEGAVDRECIIAAMQDSDIFLLPSYGEGFPNSLLEAMASGMAAIVTPVGAVPEIVGADGAVVVPAKDAKALAFAIDRLARDNALRAELASAGRTRVMSRYAESSVLSILAGSWQSVLGKKSDCVR